MLSRRKALFSMLGAALQFQLPAAWASSAGQPAAIGKTQAWGYYPLWMKESWKRLSFPLWDRMILFEFPVTGEGNLGVPANWHRGWQAMAQAADRAGTSFDLAFTVLEENRFSQLFSRAERHQRLLKGIVAAAELRGVKGIHLDFEIYGPVPDAALAGYREFMAELHPMLKRLPQRPTLSVFFPMGGQRDLLDMQTLAYVDYVVAQGYDAHWTESSTAGPVAPLKGTHRLSWEKTLRHLLELGVPRAGILFSVPYFGYEWPVESDQPRAPATGPGMTITYAPVDAGLLPRIRISATERIARHPAKRDPDSGSPYYTYQAPDGTWYQGWFEDGISLAEKFDFIHRENLCGIAVFPLGYDAGLFNRLVAEKFGTRSLPRKTE